MEKVFDTVLGGGGGQAQVAAPTPPPPPPAPPVVTAAADRVRMERESKDVQNRKRGRASTVVTGPEGVGATPIGMKTLVGS